MVLRDVDELLDDAKSCSAHQSCDRQGRQALHAVHGVFNSTQAAPSLQA